MVPGSVGCFRARILLPRAWRDWDAGKLGAVLAHERAHAGRGDWLIQVVSHVNVCIFWFHPLAWWMERELARLAEEACDDVAVAGMGNREEYAAALVDIAGAAAVDGGVLNWRVISMAKESNVMRRVNRILDARLRGLEAVRASRMGHALCVRPAGDLSVRGNEACSWKSGFERVEACRGSAGIDRASGSE